MHARQAAPGGAWAKRFLRDACPWPNHGHPGYPTGKPARIFLLNKIDYLEPAELEESLAFTRRILREAMGG